VGGPIFVGWGTGFWKMVGRGFGDQDRRRTMNRRKGRRKSREVDGGTGQPSSSIRKKSE
jgi:hypothetical protein